MLDLSRPVQTRDGRPARIIANDVKGDTENKVIALVDMGDEEILAIRLANGKLLMDDQESPDDLINVPQQRTWYVNLGHSYSSPKYAREDNPDWPVAAVTVEYDGNLQGATRVVSAELV